MPWKRQQWECRGHEGVEYIQGRWRITQGWNNEKAREGLKWALLHPGSPDRDAFHESYHKTVGEAKRAMKDLVSRTKEES